MAKDGRDSQYSKLFPETVLVSGNTTLVCHDPHKISSSGFWAGQNPLHYATPLLLTQLSVVSITSTLIDFLIRPLGQCSMVSQIFGGVLLGPSLLGHEAVIGEMLFPPRGTIIFETFATFGLTLFLFTIGVKIDPMMMFRPDWKSMVLGLSAVVITLGFATFIGILLLSTVSMDPDLAASLPIIAGSQCVVSFQNVYSVLMELKLLQSDMGRLAVSSAMFADILTVIITSVGSVILQTRNTTAAVSALEVIAFAVYLCVAIFLVRPLIKRSVRRLPEGKQVTESLVLGIFTTVLAATFVSELIGQHFVFGPLLMGWVVPEGPPLGSAIESKLHIPIAKFLYPSFLTASGLKTNVFIVNFQSLWIVAVVVILCCIVKMLAVMISAIYFKIQVRESVVLGIMLNSKGISELLLYNLLLDVKALGPEAFALSVMSVILVTAIVTPLIKFLYDPSRRNIPGRRRTIQHSKRDAELRILVCIHNQENIPEMLNLLEASNPTQENPILITAVLLVELVGRANPMLIAHQSHRILQPSSSRSGHIINALGQYELCHESCVNMTTFTSVSQFDTMHQDICRIAQDENTVIIILPFHKDWETDGSVRSINRAIQDMNLKVEENAPCTVAILVDKRILRGSESILNAQSGFHVGLVFIGGPDDAEALSYAARMARHPNVCLSILRLLLLGSDNTRERKSENNMIDEIRQINIGNDRFEYQEEMVKDGVGLAASVRNLGSTFDLILVGRNHEASPLLEGLGAWIEYHELGVVGDILAESDVERTSSILVIQQQL